MAPPGMITRHKVVTMQYSLSNDQGVAIRAANQDAIHYVHGCGKLFPKLEAALEGHGIGDIVRVRLLPDDAFGNRKGKLVQEVPLDAFPAGENIEVGGTVVGTNEDGEEISLLVTAIEDERVLLDGNTPFAGQTLVFELGIQAIRDASPDEITQGNVLST